jgi:hypothetical protein
MRRVFVLSMILLFCCRSVADAQSTFVNVSVGGEIARFGVVELEPEAVPEWRETSVDGESFGFGVSLERAIGERWGVALEFNYAGEVSGEDSYEYPITILIFPPPPPTRIEREFEYQRFSWNTLAWFAQPLGDRVELAFSAGAAFARTRFEQEQRITQPLALPPVTAIVDSLPIRLDLLAPSHSTSSVSYTVDPVVGIDARIRVGDRAWIVPSLRAQSADLGGRSGWVFRPAVAARFGF